MNVLSTVSGGTAVIELIGQQDQTIQGHLHGDSKGRFPPLRINKDAGKLFFKDDILLTGNIEYIKGQLDHSHRPVYI